MKSISMGEIESRFAELIWENAPLTSSVLVQLAAKELNWKKSTTYTVLKRLSEKGLFLNDGGTIRGQITKDEYGVMLGEELIEREFCGSLPAFLAAFSKRRTLTEEELAELRSLLEQSGKE